MEFINYSKCSTCKKAKDYLDKNNINYVDRQIKEDNPNVDEIKNWILKYEISARKLFNTSGIYDSYKLVCPVITLNKSGNITVNSPNTKGYKTTIINSFGCIIIYQKKRNSLSTHY